MNDGIKNPRETHKQPRVTLLTWTANPVETIWTLWQASRKTDPLADLPDNATKSEMERLFETIVRDKIPIAENLNFTFVLENVSISFREQMVRHRVGVKVGEQMGVDIIPELGDSTWWSQSMRILDMSKFADEGNYRLPDSLVGKEYWHPTAKIGMQADTVYWCAMQRAQEAYVDLIRAGVPAEDAREVLPMACTHRISWTLNLAAIQHIVGKRGCWILQMGLWGPIIKGMVREMADKVHPCFASLIDPPCIIKDKFTGCHFIEDNKRRVEGSDPIPPCSLYLHQAEEQRTYQTGGRLTLVASGLPPEIWTPKNSNERQRYDHMREEYRDLWQRHPDTGAKLHTIEGGVS